MISGTELLNQQFIEGRARLLDVAAFLDRVERYGGMDDERMAAFTKALTVLLDQKPERVRRILECLSDTSEALPERAPFQGAFGAPPLSTRSVAP